MNRHAETMFSRREHVPSGFRPDDDAECYTPQHSGRDNRVQAGSTVFFCRQCGVYFHGAQTSTDCPVCYTRNSVERYRR